MHVLVSGANGYFGSVTVAALAASTKISKITALVRASERFGAGESSLFPDKTSIVDVKDLLSGQFKMDGIDAICHLAAARDSQKTSDITESLQFTSALASRAIQLASHASSMHPPRRSMVSDLLFGLKLTPSHR